MGGFLFGVLIEDSNDAAPILSTQKHRGAVFLADGCAAQDRLRSAEREQTRLNKRSRRVLLPLPEKRTCICKCVFQRNPSLRTGEITAR